MVIPDRKQMAQHLRARDGDGGIRPAPVPVPILFGLQRLVAGLARAGAVSAGLAALVAVSEAYWLRAQFRRAPPETAPRAQGLYGGGYPGDPLRFAVLGDSNAVGVGAARSGQTVPALLARGLSAVAARPVQLDNVAHSGALSTDLAGQIQQLDTGNGEPEVTVIVIGGNDVIQLRSIPGAASALYSAVCKLHSGGSEVVVGTCPDMGTIRPLLPPLRFLARWDSRILATVQTIVVLRAGGRSVSFGTLLGPLYWDNASLMFSADHFHSSPLGYARAARLLWPSVLAAAIEADEMETPVPHRIYRPGRHRRLTAVAFRYAHRALAAADGEVRRRPEDRFVDLRTRFLAAARKHGWIVQRAGAVLKGRAGSSGRLRRYTTRRS